MTALPRLILHAERAGDAVARVAEELGARRVLVVSDPVVSGLPVFQEVVEALRRVAERVGVFTDVEPEPSAETARRVAREAERLGADLIVAVGGGSVIDAAKAGWLLYERPDADPLAVNPFTRYGLGRRAKLVAVPTTSGTGSDASFGVVLTDTREGRRRKLAMGSFELVPYATVLDVEAVRSLPRHLTLYTGVDALAHAVEAYVAVNANPLSDALAEKVVEIVFSDLPRLAEEPGDEAARLRMHYAATMAGMAFTASGLGLAHAVAHALGPALGLHHGLAVGLALPHAVEYNSSSPSASARYARLKSIVEALAGRPARSGFRDHLLELYREVGLPSRVSELPEPPSRGEWERLVPRIAEDALQDPELAFNPVPVGPDELRRLLERMY